MTKTLADAIALVRAGRVFLTYRTEPGTRRLDSPEPDLDCGLGNRIGATTFQGLVERGWVEWPDAGVLAGLGLTVVGDGTVPMGANGTVRVPVRLTLAAMFAPDLPIS